MNNKEILRQFIREAIKNNFSHLKERKQAEASLRSHIRQLIKEVEVADKIPHRFTGINVLEELLKKIVPIIKDDYLALTTSEEQRSSYRAHIITAVQNALRAAMHNDGAGDPAASLDIPLNENEEDDLQVRIGEDEKFIDVEKTGKEKEQTEEEGPFKTLQDMDLTGRNMAFQSFEKVEKVILNSYETLGNEEDQKIFYDYLITNLKLYFDKFESELKGTVEEPSTTQYDQTNDSEDLAI